MADVARYGGGTVRLFCYKNTIPKQLVDPISISCYVYDPSNELVFSSSQLTRDPNFPTGVFNFTVPAPTFLTPTSPTAYFTITTFSQMPDGSIETTEEIVQVQ